LQAFSASVLSLQLYAIPSTLLVLQTHTNTRAPVATFWTRSSHGVALQSCLPHPLSVTQHVHTHTHTHTHTMNSWISCSKGQTGVDPGSMHMFRVCLGRHTLARRYIVAVWTEPQKGVCKCCSMDPMLGDTQTHKHTNTHDEEHDVRSLQWIFSRGQGRPHAEATWSLFLFGGSDPTLSRITNFIC
jgi:hypothetical protein